uniref:Fungal lipase-type domain-containing protein n=1 Tax=Setaria italica TaxID=4555 RepID=K3ZHW6_SETIT
MRAKRVASVAGTAALVYVALSERLSSASGGDAAEALRRQRWWEEDEAKKGEERWPERAPASWREAAAVTARTAGLAYAETLGKWTLGDIAFGINRYMRIQGNLQHEYTGTNCIPLEGPGVRQELIGLLRYLRLCLFFTKKPYEVFLDLGGYGQSDILIRKTKSKLMKPAFTIVRDESTKCFLLFIRGATSTKDRLTAATAAEVPFQHSVLHEGCKSKLVAGHAHCGMVAAARWIADQAIPCLSKAVEQFPEYRIKIIGHSMGAGIAAILTYMLREDNKLSSSSCIAFGPAACMTWDLAESGNDFITTVVNRNDLVPSLGRASAAIIRTEVMASSQAPDLRENIQQARILGFVNSSVNLMRSHIPFLHNPGSKVADTNDELKLSADVHAAVQKHSALSCWSSVAANRQTLESLMNPTQAMSIPALMSIYAGTDQNTRESASCSDEELIRLRSDAEQTNQEEKAAGQEHMKQILKSLRSSPTPSPRHQLYPPGRIMHMVVLPCPEEQGTGKHHDQDEVVAIYQTPRSMYGKIRLARSMIRDHYMPRYIETMEMLIDKLAEDDDDDTDDQLG